MSKDENTIRIGKEEIEEEDQAIMLDKFKQIVQKHKQNNNLYMIDVLNIIDIETGNKFYSKILKLMFGNFFNWDNMKICKYIEMKDDEIKDIYRQLGSSQRDTEHFKEKLLKCKEDKVANDVNYYIRYKYNNDN